MQKFLLSFAVVLVGSVAVAATLLLKQASYSETSAQSNQLNTVSCQTGFDRPHIFGISGTFVTSAYGPLAEKEGGLIKAGSTLAQVPINWDHETIQRDGPQDYDPEAVNFPIRKAVQTGRVVVVNLSGTPVWATGNPELIPLPENRHNSTAQPNKADPIVNREFRELVKQAVRDNKDKVKYWSYWNEPNGCMSSTGGCGYTEDSLEDFAYWHKVFYDTVKAEDPTAKVIFANLDFTGPNTSFIRDAQKLTGDYKIEYDYLGINAYNKTKNAQLPIDWVRAGYDAQRSDYKKPVWLNEWGFDTLWWCDAKDEICIDRARLDIVPLVEDGLNKIRDNPWIFAAQYHHLRDEGGNYGLWDSSVPRPGGTKFLELVNSRCAPVFSTGGTTNPPANPPPPTSDSNSITIKTYYEASAHQADGQNWPRVALFANNMAGIDATATPPDDKSPCDGTVQGPSSKCGTPVLYNEKLIAEYEVAGSTFQTTHVVPINKIVDLVGNGFGITKLSYAFHNDSFGIISDRNVSITKVEFFGHDGKMILSYVPNTSNKGYAVTPAPSQDRELEKFYFDMGVINYGTVKDSNQNGMVKAFDKLELKTKPFNLSRWEMKQEGSFNILTTRLHAAIVQNYPEASLIACTVATADNAGVPIKRGQPVTLTSVASGPIGTFKFAFYNSLRRGDNNQILPYCVKGAPTQPNDGCPDGSGQLIIEGSNPQNDGKNETSDGVIQAVDWVKMPNNTVVQSVWKGDIGSNKVVPWNENFGGTNTIDWNFSNHVGGLDIGSFTYPSTPEVDAMATYAVNDQEITMEIWRNNRQYYTVAKFNADKSYIDWGTSNGWQLFVDLNEPGKENFYPGTGVVTARGSFVTGGRLYHIYWRGNQEWVRSVPIVNGVVNNTEHANDPAKGYRLGRTTADLPGSGKVQGLTYIVMPDGKIKEELWQNNQVWQRAITVNADGVPDLAGPAYGNPINVGGLVPNSDRSFSITLPYTQVYQRDPAVDNQYPDFLQVNATFVTPDNQVIGDNASCVIRMNFDKAIDGDVDGNCVNDIYDYSLLIENFGKENCQYNLTGTNGCTIDQADLNHFKPLYGQSCSE